MKRFLALILVMIFLLAAFTGCAGNKNKLDEILAAKKMVVYLNANFPPFEYFSGSDIVGVDIEIAQRIADDLGVELKIENADFDGIVASLAAGKCDIAISGMTITEERKKEVDFSIPYIKSVQYLILPQDSTIATMEDLAGKVIGTPLGYTGQFVLEDEMDPEKGGVLVDAGCELKIYKNPVDASLDITTGRLDAVIMDEFVAKSIAANDNALKAIKLVYADGGDVSEEYGVAVPKGNEQLLTRINKVIENLKANNSIEQWVVEYSQNEE